MIEVDNPDTGEKEKLQVQLRYVFSCPRIPNISHMSSSFNATVLGSKEKYGGDEETKEEEEKEDKIGEEGEGEEEDK